MIDLRNAKFAIMFVAALTNLHMTELSEKITTRGDVRTLGHRVLKIKDFQVDAALEDNPNRVQDAAYEVLRIWRYGFRRGEEAYPRLYAGQEYIFVIQKPFSCRVLKGAGSVEFARVQVVSLV